MTVATVKFIDLLQGHYRNQRQAMSNPSRWPQIDIRLTSMSEQQIEAKSWYKYKGEDSPYNRIRYDLEEMVKILFTPKRIIFLLVSLLVLSYGSMWTTGGMGILMENASKVQRGWSPK